MEVQGLNLLNDEGEKVVQSSTFAALIVTIHELLTKRVDVGEKNEISFSAKDDVWDIEWRVRIGLSLTSYLENWESLRRIEGGDTSDSGQSGTVRLSDSVSLSTPEGEFRIKRLAYEYMKSDSGYDEAAKNHHVHGACNRLLQRKELPDDALEYPARGLKYRLITIISQAIEYNDRLGIPFS